MTPEERRAKQEAAEKETLVEHVQLHLEGLGVHQVVDWENRKRRLLSMAVADLQLLCERLKDAPNGREGINMIVKAISDSDKTRREAETARYAHVTPAEVSM